MTPNSSKRKARSTDGQLAEINAARLVIIHRRLMLSPIIKESALQGLKFCGARKTHHMRRRRSKLHV